MKRQEKIVLTYFAIIALNISLLVAALSVFPAYCRTHIWPGILAIVISSLCYIAVVTYSRKFGDN